MLCCAAFLQAQELTTNQRKQVITRVEAFKNYLVKYSGGNFTYSTVIFRDSLSAMFAPDANHAIDLGGQYKGGVREEPIDNYLVKVATGYNFKVDIRFTQGQLIDCIDTLDGKSAIYVTEKCIAQKGSVNVFSEVVQVSLPDDENNYNGYKIREVAFAADFKYDQETHYQCANLINVRTEDKEKVEKQNTADVLFYSHRYTDAIEAYLFMADRYPWDGYPQLMLVTCKDSLRNDSIFLQQGKKYLGEKQPARAINWYTGHTLVFPKDTNNVWIADTIRHIRVVSADENYAASMTNALQQQKLNNFGDACYYYTNALKFKPGNRVALDSLTHTRVKDVDYANNKIDSAIRLYKENKTDNAGAYFKILDEYGRYGTHIGTEQYLYMAYLAYDHNKQVLNAMSVQTNKDFKIFRKRCYDNLINAYNQETNKEVRKKVKYFIEEIVN